MSNDRQEEDTWKKLPPEDKVKHSVRAFYVPFSR